MLTPKEQIEFEILQNKFKEDKITDKGRKYFRQLMAKKYEAAGKGIQSEMTPSEKKYYLLGKIHAMRESLDYSCDTIKRRISELEAQVSVKIKS